MLDADEFDAWFRLLETPGLGREGARRLLASFGSADQVLQASKAARQQVVGAHLAQALDTRTRRTAAAPATRPGNGWPAAKNARC